MVFSVYTIVVNREHSSAGRVSDLQFKLMGSNLVLAGYFICGRNSLHFCLQWRNDQLLRKNAHVMVVESKNSGRITGRVVLTEILLKRR